MTEIPTRIRFGNEEQPCIPPDGKCFDCGVLPGEYHDPGCDEERCPTCRTIDNRQAQRISCWCKGRGEEEEGEENG